MITFEYLEKYKKDIKNYNYEIRRIKREIIIENENTTADSVSGSSKRFPYINQHFKIEGVNDGKIRKLEKRKKYFEHRKEKLEKELEYKLKKLSEEDSVIADIIRQRYIKCREWKQVAMNCNFATEAGPRLSLDRYFEKNKVVRS